MPIYEFLCRDCDNRYDDLVGMNDVEAQTCPECTSADVVKLYSPFSVGVKAGVAIDGTSGQPGACLPGPAGQSARSGCCGGACGACG